jgi:RimJ/RimL family protein N-acetyltransferase
MSNDGLPGSLKTAEVAGRLLHCGAPLMEKMPYRPHLDDTPGSTADTPPEAAHHWRAGLPIMVGALVVLRELRLGDAPALHEALATPDIARFISPTPSSVEGFEHFIAWTHRQRAAGSYVCFAVVPRGCDTPVGLFQVRCRDNGFATAEWGFAIAREFWGSGIFVDGAELVLRFAFETLGTRRMEARAAIANQRGGAALCKVGAMREAVLRRSLTRGEEHLDQVLWTILADEWRGVRPPAGGHSLH